MLREEDMSCEDRVSESRDMSDVNSTPDNIQYGQYGSIFRTNYLIIWYGFEIDKK